MLVFNLSVAGSFPYMSYYTTLFFFVLSLHFSSCLNKLLDLISFIQSWSGADAFDLALLGGRGQLAARSRSRGFL